LSDMPPLMSPSQLPELLRDLRAHMDRARDYFPPWKRARRAELEEMAEEETEQKAEHQEKEEEDWVSWGDRAAPKPMDHMASLRIAMKAILGYTQLTWPTSENLSVGGCSCKT